jgi:signal peptidase II
MLSILWRSKAIGLAVVVLLIDILTKFMTHQMLPMKNWTTLWYPYGGIGVFKDFLGIEFSIVHATNKGAAWGVLSSYQDYLIVFRIVLILALLVYVFFINKNKNYEFPFALIIAGAIGNVLDFFIYGHVIDMLHFVLWGYDFPIFNAADSSIFLGVASLIILSWDKKGSEPQKNKKIAKS